MATQIRICEVSLPTQWLVCICLCFFSAEHSHNLWQKRIVAAWKHRTLFSVQLNLFCQWHLISRVNIICTSTGKMYFFFKFILFHNKNLCMCLEMLTYSRKHFLRLLNAFFDFILVLLACFMFLMYLFDVDVTVRVCTRCQSTG